MENPFNFEQANYSDLLTEAKRLNALVADLDGELTPLKNKYAYAERAFANRDRQYTEGRALIEEMITEGEITNEDYIKQLVEIFNIEILKQVEFTLTIEVTGTLELPMGTELDEYSFSVDSISYNGEDVSIDHEGVSIDHWNFTE